MTVPFITGWILLLIPQPLNLTSPGWFYAGRLLTGFGGGAFALASPIYISEIAEPSIRGALGSLMQFQLTLGVLFINGVGALIDWVTLTGICIVFPAILAGMMIFMPESPYYLITKNRKKDARDAMCWLRTPTANIDKELEQMQAEFDEQQAVGTVSLKQFFSAPEYLKPALIMLGLMFFQQFSGINAVIFYLTDIFIKANVDLDSGLSSTLVSLVQVKKG